MPKTAIVYHSPTWGEIYLDRNSTSYELYREKKIKELELHLTDQMRKIGKCK